jgi:hypothetical protein
MPNEIYRINSNDTNLNKIKNLNDMIIVLSGLSEMGRFDTNELNHIYAILDVSRKFLRNQGLGNTVSTYTGWTHLKAEDGYSIWYYTQSTYAYNVLNQTYFDGAILSNKGQADAESATAFDTVYIYDGSTYTDVTTEAGIEGGNEFTIIDSTGEYIYMGLSTTFAGAKFEWQTRGSNYTLKVEYYNGAWIELTANTNTLEDDTNDFESNGRITWAVPGDWSTVAVNSVTKYWIRISTTTVPITTAKCYYLIPGNSVIALLALSSTEILNENWAWCSCSTELTRIYVTIRNSGATAYEGDYYITSSSSLANKENFFVHNHPFTADYLDTLYDAVVTKTAATYTVLITDGTILGNTTSNNITLTLPTAIGYEGKRFTFKKISASNTLYIDGYLNQTIDTVANRILADNNDSITIESDGSNWQIISSHTDAFSWSSSSSSSSLG